MPHRVSRLIATDLAAKTKSAIRTSIRSTPNHRYVSLAIRMPRPPRPEMRISKRLLPSSSKGSAQRSGRPLSPHTFRTGNAATNCGLARRPFRVHLCAAPPVTHGRNCHCLAATTLLGPNRNDGLPRPSVAESRHDIASAPRNPTQATLPHYGFS
jgi:hypothetical protein